ncbi:hypothetical protein GGI07_000347 [Coemansia sp. Benny D115]|nr:hypothetical protein GGI07_000347 [Coemansia sp. Benny D115]
MEYQTRKVKRLSFKGEKKSSKRSKSDRAKTAERLKSISKPKKRSPSGGQVTNAHEAASGWVPVKSLDDLSGPLTIYFRDERLFVLALPTKEEMQVQALEGLTAPPPRMLALDDISLTMAEPTGVEQVFVGRRSIPATEKSDPDSQLYSFKSYTGTYISGNRQGSVGCHSVAIGLLEMWTPVLLPDRGDGAVAFSLQIPSVSGDRYLSVEQATENKAGLRVHTQATSIGFCEVFTVKCQAALRKNRG